VKSFVSNDVMVVFIIVLGERVVIHIVAQYFRMM